MTAFVALESTRNRIALRPQAAAATSTALGPNMTTNGAVKAHPVEYEGTAVVVDPDLMTIDEPYRISYRGKPAIAIKHSNGRVSLYRMPKG
jgi:hypothetical protein